ncbi:MAG TPA: VOC family protein [Candidatus Krumholzibacteria bacterium]|nr:VOC family protein [Candidatus Krumholzibacteria bacterium]
MLKSAIDHLVITASSRALGSDYVAEVLGVVPQPGGEHPRMGTHNALVRLGEATYLEVIAVNLAAAAPARARWFGLDDMLPSAPPRLVTWVVRTSDIQKASTLAPFSLGKIETMTREALAWRITIPEDGRMPLEGAAPSLIQWSGETHPARALPDVGCTLEELQIEHPRPKLLESLLREIGFNGPVVVSRAESGRTRLAARIRTPGGLVALGNL